jgi:mono/diheme cytochrome c family protein
MRQLFMLIVLLFLAACTAPAGLQYSDIPEIGDAVRGEELFNTSANLAPPCSGCHIAGNNASPSLDGYGEIAGSRVEGESAREYTFYSIVAPERHIVEGFGNAMYNQYGSKMSPQEIADVIEYLLSR